MGSWAMGRVEGDLRGWAGTARPGGALKDLKIHVWRQDSDTMKITGSRWNALYV